MRNFRFLLPLFVALGCTAACSHAQLPPSPGSNVLWTVTLNAASNCGTGQPACTIVISTLAVPTGTASCPASTGSNYTPQQTATTGVTGLTWTQPNTTGTTQCAVAQLVQSAQVSQPSPASSPVASPALPLAPSVGGAQQVAQLSKPEVNQPGVDAQKLPVMAINQPLVITGVHVNNPNFPWRR